MGVNLSIKNVPDALADKLRQRAEANHRSLQGELMALLEGSLAAMGAEQAHAVYGAGAAGFTAAANPRASAPAAIPARRTLREIWEEARAAQRIEAPSSALLLREMREERSEQLTGVIDAAGAYARARALLGLPRDGANEAAPKVRNALADRGVPKPKPAGRTVSRKAKKSG